MCINFISDNHEKACRKRVTKEKGVMICFGLRRHLASCSAGNVSEMESVCVGMASTRSAVVLEHACCVGVRHC